MQRDLSDKYFRSKTRLVYISTIVIKIHRVAILDGYSPSGLVTASTDKNVWTGVAAGEAFGQCYMHIYTPVYYTHFKRDKKIRRREKNKTKKRLRVIKESKKLADHKES